MTRPLDGKTAIVTGASRGIGKSIAERLAADGAEVFVHFGSNRAGAEECAARIAAAGGVAHVVGADLRDGAAIDAMIADIGGLLGERKVDILVNNAGVGLGGGIDQLTQEAFDTVFAVNVRAPLLVTKAALDRLSDGGRIIFISSMVAFAAYPQSLAYAMTKAAINSAVRSLAADLARRQITVNAIAPGATRTDFIARILDDSELTGFYEKAAVLGRLGTGEDIAGAVAFLAGRDGGWVTGQVIQASGGMHL